MSHVSLKTVPWLQACLNSRELCGVYDVSSWDLQTLANFLQLQNSDHISFPSTYLFGPLIHLHGTIFFFVCVDLALTKWHLALNLWQMSLSPSIARVEHMAQLVESHKGYHITRIPYQQHKLSLKCERYLIFSIKLTSTRFHTCDNHGRWIM